MDRRSAILHRDHHACQLCGLCGDQEWTNHLAEAIDMDTLLDAGLACEWYPSPEAQQWWHDNWGRAGAFRSTTIPLEVHHIQPRAYGGTHNADNLITLCRTCHLRVHRADWADAAENFFHRTVSVLNGRLTVRPA